MKGILLAVFITIFATTSYGEETSHHHHESASNSLSLNNGHKWEVDQVMKENMESIYSQYKLVIKLKEAKKITQKDYSTLSNIIADSTLQIANNCKLEEKADQNFHIILADLRTVSEELKDKKVEHAMKKLSYALMTYTEYFNQSFSK